MRMDNRELDQLRSISFERHYTKHAEGSVLVSFGDTKVLCTASVESGVPRWLKGKGKGWITAEYGMLPRATNTRNQREAARGKQSGRTQEIQRLIGRSLRAMIVCLREPSLGPSVGMKGGEAYLDLNYEEDSSCDTDLNVVMTQKGEFIELQGTAEEKPFTRAQADAMLSLAETGIAELIKMQQTALGW